MDILIYIFIFCCGIVLGFYIVKQKSISIKDYNTVDKQKYLLENQLGTAQNNLEELQIKYQALIQKERSLYEGLLIAENKAEAYKEKLIRQEQDLEQYHIRFRDQFEVLAHNILQKNSENFSRLNQEKIGSILTPLREKIESFEKKIEETHRLQSTDSTVLKHEIKRLSELNYQISEDAKNLTQALKGDNKVQGSWGEIVLERLLENSGLIKGSEYILQGKDLQLKNDNEDSLKPDVVIMLPDDKHIIIDSKVSLKAYDSFVMCHSDEEKITCLKLHITSIKSHVKNLSEKYYHNINTLNSPDFVLLFLPIEACFSISFQSSNFDLFSYAWDRKVVIVSPTTLLATLRTVASIWKYEKQNKNAIQIAEESGKLYDKLYSFVEDLEKIGKSIRGSQSAYEEALKKLSFGKGNVLSRAEKLKSMGINTKKSIDNLMENNNIYPHSSVGEENE